MISAIVLAAGLSSRTKKYNKLLLRYKKKRLIEHTLQNILESNIEYVIVVMGNNQNKIKKIIPYQHNIKTIYNRNYKSGMASSIKAGLKYLPKESSHFFIVLADMPEVKKKHYNKMILATNKNKKVPVVPFVNSQQANPVLFSKNFIQKLKSLRGDKGAKKILQNETKIKVIFKDKALMKDLDSLDDFKQYNQ
jgi:molybdenum cofactor cytidylyltransferase